ncbi:MAG: beta-ketoacyl-ACP synthase III [Dethiobacteria bacterium]|nr:beta-ketoacyl-ACP synthase III [Bacillota bacterium]NMD32867.1 ketoacyl-ACP synthase III [Bacillota bacterium]HOB28911.1 beta-ketoacyl-ACP synthase III [Bacillota bacterium]HPZ41475.1 beta-ketoacyl-ACP synthase III [Bacillota bacterium]HQD52427.1 beta-ketoacyl-ACP synthase III [Bacillota bacterium]
MKKCSVAITGSGAALPERRMTNFDLEKMVETSDEWIFSRTGIRERRILEEGLSNVDLSERASREALRNAGLEPEQVELILVATVTPDYPLPATACNLQARLGAFQAAAMDIAAGCSGFIYALTVADHFIRAGTYQNALVIGVEILSRIIDWEDRSTCVLFGDGAGAAVLQPVTGDRGLISFELGADGRGLESLYIPAGGVALPTSAETVQQRLHYVKMDGPEIFKFAVRVVGETLDHLLKKGELQPTDLDHLFLHQANLRIIESIRKRLKLPREKVPVNIDRYGNMSSATIPIALYEEVAAGRLKEGDLLAAVAFGAGLTWGGILMRW